MCLLHLLKIALVTAMFISLQLDSLPLWAHCCLLQSSSTFLGKPAWKLYSWSKTPPVTEQRDFRFYLAIIILSCYVAAGLINAMAHFSLGDDKTWSYSPVWHKNLLLKCRCCFVVGQIGDVKTAERYFQDVEKACQIKGSQPSHTVCMLMNRYVLLAPPCSSRTRVFIFCTGSFSLHGRGTSFRAFCRFLLPPVMRFSAGGHTSVARA